MLIFKWDWEAVKIYNNIIRGRVISIWLTKTKKSTQFNSMYYDPVMLISGGCFFECLMSISILWLPTFSKMLLTIPCKQVIELNSAVAYSACVAREAKSHNDSVVRAGKWKKSRKCESRSWCQSPSTWWICPCVTAKLWCKTVMLWLFDSQGLTPKQCLLFLSYNSERFPAIKFCRTVAMLMLHHLQGFLSVCNCNQLPKWGKDFLTHISICFLPKFS